MKVKRIGLETCLTEEQINALVTQHWETKSLVYLKPTKEQWDELIKRKTAYEDSVRFK